MDTSHVVKSLYAHDSAAVRTLHDLSAILRRFMGVEQGCPLTPTLFGLYVDGLEKHLLDTAGIHAPNLLGCLITLLLYANDLHQKSTTAAGLYRQLIALLSICAEYRLTVNRSKTKVVVFETHHGKRMHFVFNGRPVHQMDSIGSWVSHETKSMAYGAGELVGAARKAVHAMQVPCHALCSPTQQRSSSAVQASQQPCLTNVELCH